MLTLSLVTAEDFDEATNEFRTHTVPLRLEHSLLSVSKWESKYEKPFLDSVEKTQEEVRDYIEMMIVDETYPENFLELINEEHIRQVNAYFEKSHTATWFSDSKKNVASREKITSELIYYWIFSYQIPIEVEEWNLSRLFTLIRVFNVKNSKPQKKSTKQLAEERRLINERRLAEMKTTG